MQAVPENSVTVIGAGIVGLCIALELRKSGFEVRVIDPEQPGSQCSYGNAGAISSGSVAPLAMPGVVRNAARMLIDAESPLHVPFRYWLRAAPWLRQFIASARPERVEEIADALALLFSGAVEHHQALASELGCPQRVVRQGQLHLYRDAEALAKDEGSWRVRRARGVRAEIIDADAIRALEPAISERYRTAVFMPEQGAVTEPFLYCSAIAEALRQRGVDVIRDRITSLQQQRDWQLQGEQGVYRTRQVVVAAGAWSAALLRPLGLRVPLESQRGYHMHLSCPGVAISRPVVLADRKVFMVPMETGLRISGTVEFGGLHMSPTRRRAAMLGVAAREGLPELQLEQPSVWMGHRPCLPDSLPVLGPVPDRAGLWCAFGHGHLGVTGSVNSARWLGASMRGESAAPDLTPFSISRFR